MNKTDYSLHLSPRHFSLKFYRLPPYSLLGHNIHGTSLFQNISRTTTTTVLSLCHHGNRSDLLHTPYISVPWPFLTPVVLQAYNLHKMSLGKTTAGSNKTVKAPSDNS